MRVAALALGVLAGLVASLILALGGLDVAADLSGAGDRQAQAIRFGLFIIANLGVFGAALVLASPLAGAIFLILGAIAWVGAALLIRQSTDLVLITPPALLLLAMIFAVIAHFRRPIPAPAEAEEEDDDIEILAPERADRAERAGLRPSDMMEGEEEVGVPAFAVDSQARPNPQARNSDWNPRKRQPPPPRATPAFRPVEEEYDDEPSGFSRFAMGVSGLLSFGLYAALAGAAVLIFWNMRNTTDQPAAVVAEASSISSPLSTGSSVEEPRLSAAEKTLTPILGGEPIRDVATAPTAPSTSPSDLVAETATSQDPGPFGAVTMPSGTVTVPTLSDDFTSEDDGTSLPPVSGDPPSLPSDLASAEEPAPLDLEAPAPAEPTVVAAGQPWPRMVPLPIAAQRLAPGTGPTVVATPTPPANSGNTGL